jgi:hypothetical protein
MYLDSQEPATRRCALHPIAAQNTLIPARTEVTVATPMPTSSIPLVQMNAKNCHMPWVMMVSLNKLNRQATQHEH